MAGIAIEGSRDRSNPPPSEKKNSIKKKSLRGFKLRAIYCAIGLVARDIPAIKAPISLDRPI